MQEVTRRPWDWSCTRLRRRPGWPRCPRRFLRRAVLRATLRPLILTHRYVAAPALQARHPLQGPGSNPRKGDTAAAWPLPLFGSTTRTKCCNASL
eukprot:scaffold185575_cov36-Prasinocladus_malaysianus.AAC.1